MLHLLSDILDLSRIEADRMPLERNPFSLRRCVESATATVSPAARQKSLSLGCEVAPSVPDRLRGDANRLRQVLVNLLGNAVKFTSVGFVRLAVETTAGKDSGGGIELHFLVEDTGIGIAPEKQALIFEPFRQADNSTTRRYGGSGLGLAICKRLIGLMGGRTWVESEVGRGTRFHFTCWIELAPEAGGIVQPDAAPALAFVSAQPVQRSWSVLLAEDNAVNQRVMVQLLKKRGHAVTIAVDGRQAVELALRERFDLILMDVHMPEMDGFEAARAIRHGENSAGTRVPILAMTACAMKGDRERCLESGMDDYISKPVVVAELFEKLDRYAASASLQAKLKQHAAGLA